MNSWLPGLSSSQQGAAIVIRPVQTWPLLQVHAQQRCHEVRARGRQPSPEGDRPKFLLKMTESPRKLAENRRKSTKIEENRRNSRSQSCLAAKNAQVRAVARQLVRQEAAADGHGDRSATRMTESRQ